MVQVLRIPENNIRPALFSARPSLLGILAAKAQMFLAQQTSVPQAGNSRVASNRIVDDKTALDGEEGPPLQARHGRNSPCWSYRGCAFL